MTPPGARPRPTIRRPRKTRELITNEFGGQTLVERQEPAIMDDPDKLSPVMSVQQREFAYGQVAAAGEQAGQRAVGDPNSAPLGARAAFMIRNR